MRISSKSFSRPSCLRLVKKATGPLKNPRFQFGGEGPEPSAAALLLLLC